MIMCKSDIDKWVYLDMVRETLNAAGFQRYYKRFAMDYEDTFFCC